MLRDLHLEGLHTHEDCKDYVGKMFRIRFPQCPPWFSNAEVADFILKKCVLIHLNNSEDKFNLLTFMTQKLFVFAQDKCKVEGADTVMMQELLLGKLECCCSTGSFLKNVAIASKHRRNYKCLMYHRNREKLSTVFNNLQAVTYTFKC